MLRIYLARHGQDEDNSGGILNGRRDTPLTKIGVEQASQLAQKIKHAALNFDKVYTSPLARAYTTAEIITDALRIDKPTKLNGLIERDFGVMTGKFVKEIESLCAPDILKTKTVIYFLSPIGAETFPQLLERASGTLNWLIDRHKDGNVLLVSHGDIGKMIYAAYYHLEWRNVLTMFHFGNSELLLLAEDSKAEDTHVLTANQRNHCNH